MAENSPLLISEHPLQILPSLAAAVGLNEAIVLQQVHYWLKSSTKIHGDRRWTYNSYPEWQKQFPWWGVNTIRRTIAVLEQKELLVSANFNQNQFDKTKWYTIDYERLNQLVTPGFLDLPKMGRSIGENQQIDGDKTEVSIGPDWADRMTQDGPIDAPNLGSSYKETETNTEITSETNESSSPPAVSDVAISLTHTLIEKIKKNHPTSRLATQREQETRARKDWPLHVERLLHTDHRSAREVAVVIDWCQTDPFWMSTILSAKKLREKWDTLVAQITREKKNHGKTQSKPNAKSLKDRTAGIREWFAENGGDSVPEPGTAVAAEFREGDDHSHELLPDAEPGS